MTLEELISEGNTFQVKRTEPNMYFQNGFNVIENPVTYIVHGDKYLLWVENCKRFLLLNFKDDIAYANFEKSSQELPSSSTDIYKLVAILSSLKSIPEKCISHKVVSEKTEKVVVNVNQSQSVNIDIVLHALTEEIGKKGIKDLKENDGKTEEEIKNGVISKLKDFGGNTLSNILANIITNPTIWSQL